MNVFMTGATGTIGGAVARALVARGDQVTALVRDTARASELASLGVRLVPGDITDAASLPDAMAGADAVLHIAGWYHVGGRDTHQAQLINVDGTRNVLHAMRDLGIPKGVYTSTLAVFSDTHGVEVDETFRPDPAQGFLSEYDRTKHEAHFGVARPLIEDGLPLVIVQPGVAYGPDDPSAIGRTLRRMLQGRLPLLPQRTAYSWAHVDDVARSHLLALDHGRVGETYIVCGPSHTLIEAMELAARLSGRRAPRLHAAPAVLRTLSRVTAPLARLMNLPDDLHPETLRVIAGVTYLGDNAKARSELGFTPRSLEVGLRDVLPHELAQLGLPVPADLRSA